MYKPDISAANAPGSHQISNSIGRKRSKQTPHCDQYTAHASVEMLCNESESLSIDAAEQPEPLSVKIDSIMDWGFCYSSEPSVWVTTQLAWYAVLTTLTPFYWSLTCTGRAHLLVLLSSGSTRKCRTSAQMSNHCPASNAACVHVHVT